VYVLILYIPIFYGETKIKIIRYYKILNIRYLYYIFQIIVLSDSMLCKIWSFESKTSTAIVPARSLQIAISSPAYCLSC